MSDVFISYSRKDIAFARLLHQALKENDLETWIDWQDIPPSADWLAEVYEAIEGSDSFVFIISETSLNSEICGLEIAHAAAHNKRLIPIVVHDVDAEKVPKELAAVNWIFFEQAGEQFARAVEDLITAITVDQAWVKAHTRFENRALDWERRGRDRGLLLRGADLAEAESWLAGSGGKDPQPTALQTRYILKSREDATRRGRITLGAVGAGLVIAIGLGILAWTQRNVAVDESEARATAQREAERAQALAEAASTQAVEQRDEAERQARLARAGLYSVEALSHLDDGLSLSLLLSVEAVKQAETVQSRSSLLSAINHNPGMVRVYHDYPGPATNVAYSPDGSILVTAGCAHPGDSSVTLTCSGAELIFYEAASGQMLDRRGTEHAVFVSNLVFSPDGSLLASSDWDGKIIIWDVQSRAPLGEPLFGWGGRVLDIVFTPDGERLISSHEIINTSSDLYGSELRVWDPHTLEQLEMIPRPTSLAYSNLVITPDGSSMIGTQLSSTSIARWDLDTWERDLEAFSGYPEVVRSMALSPDGERLLLGNLDGSLMFWDLTQGVQLPNQLEGHSDAVDDVAYSPDGGMIVSVSADQTIRLWDANAYTQIGDPFASAAAGVGDVAYHPEGEVFATASADGSVTIWSPEARTALAQVLSGHNASVWAVDFTGDGEFIASASADEAVKIWDARANPEEARSLLGDSGQLYALAFSPDDSLLVVGGQTGLEVWDWRAGNRVLAMREGHAAPIVSLSFSPEGEMIASGGMDSQILLWDPASGAQIGVPLVGHAATVNALAFSPDGDLLASAGCAYESEDFCQGGEVILWDMRAGPKRMESISAHDHNIYALAFSPDGSQFATGSTDETIWLWDAQTREPLGEPILGHEFGVVSLAYSPDGTLLASGGLDEVVVLTDLASRQRIGPALKGHQGVVNSLAFSPSGDRLASASHDGDVLLWPTATAAWIKRACERAGRNLTRAEWGRYFPGDPYRVTCPEWPGGS